MTKRTATKRHKVHKSILGLCLFVAITLLGQAPTFEGTWYGTINPPSLQFNIAVRFQKSGDSWSGTLLLENALMSFMAVLLGTPNLQVSLDCLLHILFERSGARMETASQVMRLTLAFWR